MIEQLLKKSADLIEKSNSVLIVPSPLLSDKIVGTAFGLALFLESQGKKAEILITGDLNEKFNSLPDSFKKPSSLIPEIYDSRAFVIKINTKEKTPNQLKYETEKNCLKIIIDSAEENYDPKDISFEYTSFNYDLIITVGIGDIKNIDDIYVKNKTLFETVPVLAINKKVALNNFLSEVIFLIISQINKKSINKNIANWLALALVDESGNLKNQTGQTVNIFSELLNCGAQKDKIAKLSQTKEDDTILKVATRIAALKEIVKIKNNLFIKIPPKFFKEEITKQSLLNLAREISFIFLKTDNIFMLFEKSGDIIAVGYIKNLADLEKIRGQINGQVFENCILAKIKAQNIDEAEEKLITLLNISW